MLTQADSSKLEAFEMWISGRMEKISWVDKKANEKILHMVQQNRKILTDIQTVNNIYTDMWCLFEDKCKQSTSISKIIL